MDYCFSPAGLNKLQHAITATTLLASDFDGTLAPIVEHPIDAVMQSNTKALLNSLAPKMPVAVISGRAMEDLTRLIDNPHIRLSGNHGIEGIGDHYDLQQAERICNQWYEQLCDFIAMNNIAGFIVEHKRYSLSLHYRQVESPAVAEQYTAQWMTQLIPQPKIITGKAVLNIMPPNAPDKSDALRYLMETEGFIQGIFIGDDDTDEIVFQRIASHVLHIQVGYPGTSAAHLYLENQSQITLLLQYVCDFLDETSKDDKA